MPLPELTKTISLGEVGAPEFQVTFKRVPALKYGEMRKIFGNEKEDSDPDELVKLRFAQLITAWNLIDYDGNPFALPLQNPDVVFEIPTSFADFISKMMLDDAVGWSEEAGSFLAEKSNSS